MHHDGGGDDLPSPLPEESWVGIEPQHELHVLQEPVSPIDPRHDGHLGAAEDEGRVGGRVVVHQLQDVHPTLGNHEQPTAVHEGTDTHQQPPSVLPSQVGELVQDDGDDSLGGGELGPKPKGEQHDEEEDGPSQVDPTENSQIKQEMWMMSGSGRDGEDSNEFEIPPEQYEQDMQAEDEQYIQAGNEGLTGQQELALLKKEFQKKYPCEFCHKRFPTPSKLQRHQLVHSGEK